MNPKRKAYRNPDHPRYGDYLDHRIEMDDRKRRRSKLTANLRRYRVAGESGGNNYLAKNGKIVKIKSGIVQSVRNMMLPRTGIARSQ